jgi:hypothetical protein
MPKSKLKSIKNKEKIMKLHELLDEGRVYNEVEQEIRDWILQKYNGVYDIEFHNKPAFDDKGRRLPDCEIVQCVPVVRQTPETAQEVVRTVNQKIDEILQEYDEDIYLSERLTRIYKMHPRFKNTEIDSIAELKKDKRFLIYLKELIIKPKRRVGYDRTN